MIESFESRIEDNQQLLHSIVSRIHGRLPSFILYEDVLAYGQVGLAQAARTYQPQPNAKFSTYAYYRISGAVYDGISKMNWSSRSEYRRAKASQASNDLLEEQSSSSQPTKPEQYANWFSETVESVSAVYVFSAGDPENPFENQIEGKDQNPSEAAESSELVKLLRKAIEQLSEEEATLIRLTYFENLSIAEAAKQIGKSRSWGSRTHLRIIKSLSIQLLGDA